MAVTKTMTGIAVLVALAAHAYAAELDIEVDLRQHQWDFVQACEEAGYTRASKYRDCIERASIADSTDQVSTMLNTAWQRTCGLTYELFRDRETYLTDLAFYAMACKEYQTRD